MLDFRTLFFYALNVTNYAFEIYQLCHNYAQEKVKIASQPSGQYCNLVYLCLENFHGEKDEIFIIRQ